MFAVLTSHLLLVFRLVHSKSQIKFEMRGFPGAERILQLLNIAILDVIIRGPVYLIVMCYDMSVQFYRTIF